MYIYIRLGISPTDTSPTGHFPDYTFPLPDISELIKID